MFFCYLILIYPSRLRDYFVTLRTYFSFLIFFFFSFWKTLWNWDSKKQTKKASPLLIKLAKQRWKMWWQPAFGIVVGSYAFPLITNDAKNLCLCTFSGIAFPEIDAHWFFGTKQSLFFLTLIMGWLDANTFKSLSQK